MDNFSQENMEEEVEKLSKPSSGNSQIDDIQFEETIDIEELQKQLHKKIEQSNLGIEEPDEPENDSENIEKTLPSVLSEAKDTQITKKQDPNSKKYVIYINHDNIDFMENLSINERKDLINKVLKEQNAISMKNKELEARKRYVANLILACITFVICFPILFFIVNKATEATIDNYYQARENFTKLYREQGKIKPRE